jgi:hypothetical protein
VREGKEEVGFFLVLGTAFTRAEAEEARDAGERASMVDQGLRSHAAAM